jgi:hypothetical protein
MEGKFADLFIMSLYPDINNLNIRIGLTLKISFSSFLFFKSGDLGIVEDIL